MAEDRLRVAVADDTLLMRQGVVAIVEAIEGVEVVGAYEDADALLDAIESINPDVVLTDIAMPPTHTDEGIRAATTIRTDRPGTGVVVLSQYAEPQYVLDLFDRGSDGLGYLLKERVGDPAELERAIRAVADGESVVDPRIVEILVSTQRTQDSITDRLTPREAEVLSLMAEGLNNSTIAGRLVLSDKAVAKHINNIFSKLDLGGDDETHRRVKAVLTWLAR